MFCFFNLVFFPFERKQEVFCSVTQQYDVVERKTVLLRYTTAAAILLIFFTLIPMWVKMLDVICAVTQLLLCLRFFKVYCGF